MKLMFPSLKTFFKSVSNKSEQSAKITGEGNTLNQNITNVFVGDPDGELKRELLANPEATSSAMAFQLLEAAGGEAEDSEEVKRIVEYRQLAKDGDSQTALSLLRKLESDKRYGSGYLAFRLHFNIGIVLLNTGDFENASVSLRTAYSNFPSDAKAQTGLALAELIDGKPALAIEHASKLVRSEGDHQGLAISVVLQAAKQTGTTIDRLGLEDEEQTRPEVISAYLEYLRVVYPLEYPEALNQAYNSNPDHEEVASLWALSVLDDIKQNQAFLLGAKMQDGFEQRVLESAEILKKALEKSLKQRPPNKLLLPSQANNAAVALRLSGNVTAASQLIQTVLEKFPELAGDLAQIRAVLLLQEERDGEALAVLGPLKDVAELQIMAAEIEAKSGYEDKALQRINDVLNSELPEDLKTKALFVKARICINQLDQKSTDDALDELVVIAPKSQEVLLLKSSYDRAFVIRAEKDAVERIPIKKAEKTFEERKLLASLKEAENWDFLTLLQASEELLVRGYFRECTDLLRDRVSLLKESPALQTLCDACLRGHLAALATELNDGLSTEVKNSAFGWKFGTNVAYLTGDITKAVPLTRKLYEQNPSSINSLEWYVQSLLRTNDRKRIQRVVRDLDDDKLFGSVQERRGYVNLLNFCGEAERARNYAYKLFCENQNDHHAWMALSASVLEFGSPPNSSDELDFASVQENCSFVVLTPNGIEQTFTIETDEHLLSLRDGGIRPNHPVAQAANGLKQGESFEWPFREGGQATVVNVRHKAVAAFQMIATRFEERFPEANGFKSISMNVENEDGLDEMRAMLRQRASYSQSKAKEYHEGSYPIYILGYHLGIDPIDAMLGLKSECGFPLKVSSCSHVDQDKAEASLSAAKKSGIIADAGACYLFRRLGVDGAVAQEFGSIGVTQETIDVFTQRFLEASNSSFVDAETGRKKSSSVAFRDGQIVYNELTEEEVDSRNEMLGADLDWLKSDCELLPAVPKTDPNDAILRFRAEEGGRFFDDIFAADGTGRVLISEDINLRQWSEGLFQVRSAWVQSLLFHLEACGRLTSREVVKSTISLLQLGEEALSTSSERLLVAAEMFSSGELTEEEFTAYCSLLGQTGADMQSHIAVAVSSIRGFWSISSMIGIRQRATSILLRNLTRFQGDSARVVLDTVQTQVRFSPIQRYIAGWRVGHFFA